MRFALAAADTVVRLADSLDGLVVGSQIFPLQSGEAQLLGTLGYRALIHVSIVMLEDAGNVDSIRTRHTVFAVIAWDGFQSEQVIGNLLQESKVIVTEGLQRGLRPEVVLQMLHKRHATQHGQYTLGSACETESPRCHAAFRLSLF